MCKGTSKENAKGLESIHVMSRVLIDQSIIEKGEYSIRTYLYSDNSIRVELCDALGDLIEYIEVSDVDNIDFRMN